MSDLTLLACNLAQDFSHCDINDDSFYNFNTTLPLLANTPLTNVTSSEYFYTYETAINPTKAILNLVDLNIYANQADIDVTVYADDNTSFSSPESDTFTVGESDLVGDYNHQAILNLSFTTAYKYFKIKIETAKSFAHKFGGCVLGVPLDLGCNPITPISYNIRPEYQSFRHIPSKVYNLQFQGVTKANADKLIKYFENRKYSELAIIDSSTDILKNEVIWGNIINDLRVTQLIDSYNIAFDFEVLI